MTFCRNTSMGKSDNRQNSTVRNSVQLHHQGDLSASSSSCSSSTTLTAYEQDRSPQALRDDTDSDVYFAPKRFRAELCCPICSDMFTNTVVTKECLHRFCSACIVPRVDNGLTNCPTCDKKLSTKNPLRSDANFDALIKKLCPDRSFDIRRNQSATDFDHIDDQRRRKRPKEFADRSQKLSTPSSSTICSFTATNLAKQSSDDTNRRKNESMSTTAIVNGTALNGSDTSTELLSDIELILLPHPSLLKRENIPGSAKQSRYIVTTGMATIDHLCKYLATRIDIESHPLVDLATASVSTPRINAVDYLISIDDPNCDGTVSIGGNSTLDDVRRLHWKRRNKPFQLVFQLTTTMASSTMPITS